MFRTDIRDEEVGRCLRVSLDKDIQSSEVPSRLHTILYTLIYTDLKQLLNFTPHL